MQLKKVSIIFYALMAFLFSCKAQKAFHNHLKSSVAKGYKLVWADEFNRHGAPNALDWGYEIGFVRNQEQQWYQPKNAFCKNGVLIIEGRRELRPTPDYDSTSKDWRKVRKNVLYTSSSINTSRKHSWKYGRFVMRGRIDISAGLWPAWWTLGINGDWPANGEADIMEYYKRKLLANVAFLGGDGNAAWYSNTFSVDSMGSSNWSSKFHTLVMDWSEESISFYLDNVLLNKVELDNLVNQNGSGINPFKQPHYMLLNLAVGGLKGGELSNTRFPNRFEVDYVRVYQKKP